MGCVVQDRARAGRRALSHFQQVVTSAYSGRRLLTSSSARLPFTAMFFARLGAAVAAADRLFHLVYYGFSCIDFSEPSHLPNHVRTSSGSSGSAYHGRCHRLHLEAAGYLARTGTIGDGGTSHDRPTVMTAKHGVGGFPSCCLSKGLHVMRASRMVSVSIDSSFSRRIGVSLISMPHGREGHRRTHKSAANDG